MQKLSHGIFYFHNGDNSHRKHTPTNLYLPEPSLTKNSPVNGLCHWFIPLLTQLNCNFSSENQLLPLTLQSPKQLNARAWCNTHWIQYAQASRPVLAQLMKNRDSSSFPILRLQLVKKSGQGNWTLLLPVRGV